MNIPTSDTSMLKAVIIVGGPAADTDFRPLSLTLPKPLFPIAGRPVIQHHLEALARVPGLQQVFLIGYYEASLFAPFLEEWEHSYPFTLK